ncbi:MAG: heavy-metal-associated domain-containing protein [Deltaproteobacteria bacterium]|nr:heavy-metal-associated domain-containing protein [Deltaproteobacteria bacterium]
MEEKTVHIPSITCGHCVMTIKNEIGELEGVKSVEGDENSKLISIKWEAPASWKEIDDLLKEIGYPAE